MGFNKIITFLTYLYWYIPQPLGLIISKTAQIKLKKRLRKIKSLGECIDLAYSFRFFPFAPSMGRIEPFAIKPAQVKEEITGLLKILNNFKPTTILEIGTYRGGTLFLFSTIASSDVKLISIDLLGGPFRWGYPSWKIPLYKSFTRNPNQTYLLRANSHNPSTLEKVEQVLKDRPLDFLFIDGDHTYEGVKKDFKMYSLLVKKGGVIAFHDIIPGPPESIYGVPKFWEEIKSNFNYVEIVKGWKQGIAGIGVLYL